MLFIPPPAPLPPNKRISQKKRAAYAEQLLRYQKALFTLHTGLPATGKNAANYFGVHQKKQAKTLEKPRYWAEFTSLLRDEEIARMVDQVG